jgi:16S rRNA (cytosine967-C5)-methyltransferase
MHPKALLSASTDLVREILRFEHPADSVLSKFFKDHRKDYSFGHRERGVLADTAYNVLRFKQLYEHFAPWGSGPKERRLAILGFAQHLRDVAQNNPSRSSPASSSPGTGISTKTGHPVSKEAAVKTEQGVLSFLIAALTPQEIEWLHQCESVDQSELLERHRHNLPEWLALSLKEQLGEGFWQVIDALNAPAPLDLRVNTFVAKREDVLSQLSQLGLNPVPTPYSPWGIRLMDKPSLTQLDLFKRGVIEVQDEGSQLLALLLDAKRGEMVADFCAGAGGKTLAIGASMRSTGRLYAFDTSAHRLEALKPRLARSSLSNVHPVAIAHERDERIKRLRGKMDRVLVDAPCSGLGTLRRNPDLKWRQTPKSIDELCSIQLNILRSAARLLKPGARLVYATCSLLMQENEAIAETFTREFNQLTPLKVSDVLDELKTPHFDSLCTSNGDYLRLWPHVHETDGFFASVWQAQ